MAKKATIKRKHLIGIALHILIEQPNASLSAGVICLFRDLCGSWSKGQYFYHPVNRLEKRRYDPVNEYRLSNDRAAITKQLNEK